MTRQDRIEELLAGVPAGDRAQVRQQVYDQIGQVEQRRDAASMFDTREVGAALDAVGRVHGARVLDGPHPPAPGSPEWHHAQTAATALAHAQQNRGDWSDTTSVEPAPQWSVVNARHPAGYSFRMRTDGRSWALLLRGAEYGCGPVHRRERNEDGTWTPGQQTLSQADAAAWRDPSGPEGRQEGMTAEKAAEALSGAYRPSPTVLAGLLGKRGQR